MSGQPRNYLPTLLRSESRPLLASPSVTLRQKGELFLATATAIDDLIIENTNLRNTIDAILNLAKSALPTE